MNRAESFRELEAVYAELAEELGRLRPVCQRSGRCCRFKEFGHELWITALELDYLVERAGTPPTGAPDQCPYLEGGLCGVRDHRMLGCRIFFCDPDYTAAMGPLYERFRGRIREIHRRLGIPYEYGEFLKMWARRQPLASPSDPPEPRD
jgi:hypothetical protein